jgi:nicotinamidase-related amidase
MSRRLDAEDTALLLVDWQVRLFGAMPEAHRDAALAQAANLRWLAGELGVPVITSEQYPRGLGPTLDDLAVDDAIEKSCFSAMSCTPFAERLAATGRRTILLTGMETHICVAQTAAELLDAGHRVHVVADACLSRRTLDWRIGIDRMVADGARPLTTEAVMFELIGAAGTPLFKEVSRRIK